MRNFFRRGSLLHAKCLLWVLLAFVLLVGFAVGFRLVYRKILLDHLFGLSKVYVAANTAELAKQGRSAFGGAKIPESATEIYIYEARGRDTSFWCSLTLAPEDVVPFAEEFAGVPISGFKDGHASRSISVNKAPGERGRYWKPHYWNIADIKRGKYYETPTTGAGCFIVIDLDTNRVYLRKWQS